MLSLLLPTALLAAQAQPAPTLAADAEARWVPFELSAGNQLRFAMDVDGRPARAILDTGLSDTIVTARFARVAGLRAKGGEQATAIGGSVRLAWAPVRSLAFGALSRHGGRIGIAGSGGEARFEADVFVGSDILGCCALDIDYDGRRFRILPSGRLPFAGSTAPLSRARPSGVPLSEVALSGKRLRPMIVDTGDGSSVTLTRRAWTGAAPAGTKLTTTLGWGVGGAVVSDMAVIPGVSLAGIAAGETEVRIEEDHGYSAKAGAAGRIGSGLLMRFRVLLDPKAGRMVVRAGRTIDTATPRSTSGLLLGIAQDRLDVLHVMRGSPAAETGWKAGEAICTVDAAPVARLAESGHAIDWGADAPGRTVRLGLCDGRERRLTLRRFY